MLLGQKAKHHLKGVKDKYLLVCYYVAKVDCNFEKSLLTTWMHKVNDYEKVTWHVSEAM